MTVTSPAVLHERQHRCKSPLQLAAGLCDQIVDDMELLGIRDRVQLAAALAALASAQAHDRQAAALESIAVALATLARAA